MNLLQRIWDDIQRSENIDLYATGVVALGLATLNIIGLAPQKWIAPLTLTILGLIAVSTLVNRYRVEGLMRKLTLSVDSVFLSEVPPSIKVTSRQRRSFG